MTSKVQELSSKNSKERMAGTIPILGLPNINTYFSLRVKCWFRGGVGGQFPRDIYRSRDAL